MGRERKDNHRIVRARSDGRGGITPFGLSGKDARKLAGRTVYAGDRKYKIGRDGRFHAPKEIMETYGVMGDDGRRRLGFTFSSNAAGELAVTFFTPRGADRNAQTGERSQSARDVLKDPHSFRDGALVHVPSDAADFNWSPVQ